MRKFLFTTFILNIALVVAQTKQPGIKVNLLMYYTFEKITLTIKSERDSLNNCIVQIMDANNKVVKTIDLPEAGTLIENNIAILDLNVGKYSCTVSKGKKELYKGEFFKDGFDGSAASISIPNDRWIQIPNAVKK